MVAAGMEAASVSDPRDPVCCSLFRYLVLGLCQQVAGLDLTPDPPATHGRPSSQAELLGRGRQERS